MTDSYFANLPPNEIGAEIMRRWEDYADYCYRSGRLARWRRSYEFFHMAKKTGGQLYYSGKQEEYVNADIADYRNILLHLHVMTTSQRLAFEPKASNTDHKSMSQTVIASGLLDYYLYEKKIERYCNRTDLNALLFDHAYVVLDWDATAGEDYGVKPGGGVIKEGDIKAKAKTPMEVAIDYCRTDADHEWWIVKDYENKWNLAAKYPTLKDEILKTSMEVSDTVRQYAFDFWLEESDDLIPVYTLIHRKTDAVPKGLICKLVSPEAILNYGPLPFRDRNVHRMAPAEQEGTPFGYTVAYDLLPLQDALNKLYSMIITNQSNFGVQNIAAPKGSNLSVAQVMEGLNLFEYDVVGGVPLKPEALNLLATQKEIFEFIAMIQTKMEILSGVNSVARGQPEASLKSGAALALVQSTAIQFNSGLQQAYAMLAEDVGTGIIRILKDFAKFERVSLIAGKANRSYMKQWSSKDLEAIDRVKVDLGNPLSRTTAGKVNMAEQLLTAQLIKTPEQYIQVVTTGKLEPAIENEQAELMNIRAENEQLSEGKRALAVVTDNHALHIKEHKVVLSSPEARQDPTVVKSCTEHLNMHLRLLRESDPMLLQLLGNQPVPPQQAPVAPGPTGAGGPMEPGAPMPLPNMPKMPTNPLTGEPADLELETGGQLPT